MRKVKTVTRVEEITLNHEDWELYDTAPGVDSIAAALNQKFMDCVNSGMSARETEREMVELMRRYDYAGACDSEPRWKLEDLLAHVYGRSSNE